MDVRRVVHRPLVVLAFVAALLAWSAAVATTGWLGAPTSVADAQLPGADDDGAEDGADGVDGAEDGADDGLFDDGGDADGTDADGTDADGTEDGFDDDGFDDEDGFGDDDFGDDDFETEGETLGDQNDAPVGGVDAGFGGTAGDQTLLLTAVAAALLVLTFASWATVRRRVDA